VALLAQEKHNEPVREYLPLPKQALFHASKAKYRLLVGGFRAAKSRACVREVLKWATVEYPGSRILVGRLTWTALRDTTQRMFMEEIWAAERDMGKKLITYESRQRGLLKLRTVKKGVQSEILFRRLDEPGPLGSLELDAFFIDEAHEVDGSEVPEETFKMLQSRLSRSVGPLRGLVCTNPGGQDWIYKYFVSKEAVPKSQHEDYQHWVMTTAENKINLPPGYVEGLYEQHRDPETGELDEWGRRYLEASFEVFAGQIYSIYESRHIVDPFVIPEHWQVDAGFDLGISALTTVTVAAVDPETGTVYIVDEHAAPEAEPKVVASWMKNPHQYCQRGVNAAWSCPAVKQRGAMKINAQEIYIEEGVTLRPGQTDLLAGIMRCRQFLKQDKLKFFRTCHQTIHAMRQWKWDPKTGKPSDDENKHLCDAIRYLIMSRPLEIVSGEPGFASDYPKPNPVKYQGTVKPPTVNDLLAMAASSLKEDEERAFALREVS